MLPAKTGGGTAAGLHRSTQADLFTYRIIIT